MQSKTSPKVGRNDEFPIPRKEEAVNSRKLGGEFVPGFPAEKSIVSARGKVKSKYPLETSRSGERRI